MSGKVINILGTKATGKSTIVAELLNKVPNKNTIFCFDVNKEHTQFGENSFVEFEPFIKKAVHLTNSVIVIEEATIFLNHFKQRDVVNLLVRARHTNNTLIFVWHSFRAFPRYIYDLGNFIIIKKTNDQNSFVDKRFEDPRLTKIHQLVNEHENRYYYKSLEYA